MSHVIIRLESHLFLINYLLFVQVRYKVFEEDEVVKRIEMKTPESRVVNSLSNVLWPMVQSAFSTLLCVLPLAILQVSFSNTSP